MDFTAPQLKLLNEAPIVDLPTSEDDWLELVIAYLERDKGRNKILTSSFLRDAVGQITGPKHLSQLNREFKSQLEDLREIAELEIEERERTRIADKQRKREEREKGKSKRAEKQKRIEIGNPKDELFRLLDEVDAVKIKSRGHPKWKLPNGETFTLVGTPSDYRSWDNALSDLRRTLAL